MSKAVLKLRLNRAYSKIKCSDIEAESLSAAFFPHKGRQDIITARVHRIVQIRSEDTKRPLHRLFLAQSARPVTIRRDRYQKGRTGGQTK